MISKYLKLELYLNVMMMNLPTTALKVLSQAQIDLIILIVSISYRYFLVMPGITLSMVSILFPSVMYVLGGTYIK